MHICQTDVPSHAEREDRVSYPGQYMVGVLAKKPEAMRQAGLSGIMTASQI